MEFNQIKEKLTKILKEETKNLINEDWKKNEEFEREYELIIKNLENLKLNEVENIIKRKNLIVVIEDLRQSTNEFEEAIYDHESSIYAQECLEEEELEEALEQTAQYRDEVVNKKYDLERTIF